MLDNVGMYKRVSQNRNYKQYEKIYNHYSKVYDFYNFIIADIKGYNNQQVLDIVDDFYEKISSKYFEFGRTDFPNFYHYKIEALKNHCLDMFEFLKDFLPEKEYELAGLSDGNEKIYGKYKFKHFDETRSTLNDMWGTYIKIDNIRYKGKIRKIDFSKEEWYELHFGHK
jgi:hypothetical protein